MRAALEARDEEHVPSQAMSLSSIQLHAAIAVLEAPLPRDSIKEHRSRERRKLFLPPLGSSQYDAPRCGACDCGKLPRSGVDELVVSPVAVSQAMQRAGRAGREGPGKCFRAFFGKNSSSICSAGILTWLQQKTIRNWNLGLTKEHFHPTPDT